MVPLSADTNSKVLGWVRMSSNVKGSLTLVIYHYYPGSDDENFFKVAFLAQVNLESLLDYKRQLFDVCPLRIST